jgi:glycosyltransferase involved in cell wall biosynthesis
MYIWYISLYEPMPINSHTTRMMRSGFISTLLHASGHEVELWVPGFEHSQHTQYQETSIFLNFPNSFSVQYIRNIGYQNDVSLRRWLADVLCARELEKLMKTRDRLPDLIITQIPTLKMAEKAVNFAVCKRIPAVVDIRDPWPDIYKRIFPRFFRRLYFLLFANEIRRVKFILRNASAITAVSKTYLKWVDNYLPVQNETPKEFFHIGYDENSFKFHHCEKYRFRGLDRKKLSAVYVGTFGRNIDIELLIALAAKIDTNKDSIVLNIYGSGEGAGKLVEAQKIYPCIRYWGWKYADALPKIFMESDVGLVLYPRGALNSLTNKIFEYLAGSLPIISTLELEEPCSLLDVTGTGLNCLPGDLESVYKALRHYQILKIEGKLEAEKVKCRKVFERYFSVETIYERYVSFIERIINPKLFGIRRN